jgi:hypothetical protein
VSAAFGSQTTLVRVHVDAIGVIAFGSAPVASTTTGIRMVAGQTEYFAVNGGQKVAVIVAT